MEIHIQGNLTFVPGYVFRTRCHPSSVFIYVGVEAPRPHSSTCFEIHLSGLNSYLSCTYYILGIESGIREALTAHWKLVDIGYTT